MIVFLEYDIGTLLSPSSTYMIINIVNTIIAKIAKEPIEISVHLYLPN